MAAAGSPQRLSGRVLLVSGRTGHVIRWVGVPDNRESYYSPQIITHLDQVPVLLFGTGGETHNGIAMGVGGGESSGGIDGSGKWKDQGICRWEKRCRWKYGWIG